MNRSMIGAVGIVVFACVSLSQSAPEITFSLGTVGGRSVFRMGEAIRLETRFSSSVSNKYEVHESDPRRRVYYGSPTQFVSEPAEGVVDPLGDYVYQWPAVAGGAPPRVWPLTPKEVVIEQTLNDWLYFQKPGRYRIVGESSSVTLAGQGQVMDPRNPIPVKSNAIEIEIVAAAPRWTEEQQQQAGRALLEAYEARQSMLRDPNLRPIQALISEQPAAVLLRYLGTPEAARTLVHFLDLLPDVGAEIQAGLWASPHREEVIRTMEEELDSPDFEVTDYWLDRLTFLSAGNAIGPRRNGNPRQPDRQWMDQLHEEWKVQWPRYVARLESALPRKRGKASETSAKTAIKIRQQMAR